MRVEWLESRTLLNGGPFVGPLPVGITQSPAAGVPASVELIDPVGPSEEGAPASPADPDPTGIPTALTKREANDVLTTDSPLGGNPVELRSGDFNGDGRPDLATANRYSDDVLVLLGSGDGTFQEQRGVAVGAFPSALVVADVNGDGRPDLITANRYSDDVLVLVGSGDGTFLELLRPARGGLSLAQVVPDRNGDGPLDPATINAGSNDSLAPINAGSDDLTSFFDFLPTPGPGRSILTGGSSPLAGSAGDFNANGFGALFDAHNGDGVVSRLLGGLRGLSLASTASHSSGLAQPTAVALSALGIAVADEGEEAVSRFRLAFDFGIAVLPRADGPEPTEQADFLPLPESNLAIVAVLLTDRLGDTAATRTRTTASDVDAVPGGNALLINFLSGPDPTFDPKAAGARSNPISRALAVLGRALNQALSIGAGPSRDPVIGAFRDDAATRPVGGVLAPLDRALNKVLPILARPAGPTGDPVSGAIQDQAATRPSARVHAALNRVLNEVLSDVLRQTGRTRDPVTDAIRDEAATKPVVQVLAPLDRAVNRWLSSFTGQTGRTLDLVSGAVDEAVQAVVSAVVSWLSPRQEFLRALLAGEAPTADAAGPNGGRESDDADHPSPVEGAAAIEAPLSPSHEDGTGSIPVGLVDAALPLIDFPPRGDRREAPPRMDTSTATDAMGDLSAGVFLAAVAYQACWSDRRVSGRIRRDRLPGAGIRTIPSPIGRGPG